ncbi:MAG TPA: 2-phosphosulfolactate phosphatase [Tepidisphaeraceae bacterium]|nr:2-phosphosulfolactate phosphatase [Tepidisphaeraceae bacterium]
MNVDVVLLPRDLRPDAHLAGRAVAVFDVLRATTTMAAALAAGVSEIRLFGDLASARAAADASAAVTADAECDAAAAVTAGANRDAADRRSATRLLVGEQACLAPPGFDLGNSPGAFDAAPHRGATVFMCTTNGTRALLAARSADFVFTAAVVNAAAAARALARTGRDITLLCAGTNDQVAMEDAIGAGAVIDALRTLGPVAPASDAARLAERAFDSARHDLRSVFRDTAGGRNIIAAGLDADINFAARLDALDTVGRAAGEPLTVRRVE